MGKRKREKRSWHGGKRRRMERKKPHLVHAMKIRGARRRRKRKIEKKGGGKTRKAKKAYKYICRLARNNLKSMERNEGTRQEMGNDAK